MTQRWIRRRLFVTAILALLLASCSNQETGNNTASTPDLAPSTTPDTNDSPLIVSAAASTKEAIEALAEKFQAQSGSHVTVNLGPSSALANQIIAGAPADLFLSANQQWADEVEPARWAYR
jgi:molybdate transport system substrate-binding protein